MLGVRSAAGCSRFHRLALTGNAFQRAPGQCTKRVFNKTSCRSRKLGTAFRSLVTTLSPPLRGQRSQPAPSLPRQNIFANPFDPELLRSVRFRSRYRANSSPRTRCPRRTPPLWQCPPDSTPLQVLLEPSGSKRSTGCITTSSPRLTPGCLLLPGTRSFDFASDRCSKPSFVLPGYRPVNPGTDSDHGPGTAYSSNGNVTDSGAFLSFVIHDFSATYAGSEVDSMCINQRRANLFLLKALALRMVAEIHQHWCHRIEAG